MFRLSHNDAVALAVLARKRGRVASYGSFAAELGWQDARAIARVRVIVCRLRQKFRRAGRDPIRNVAGVGYALVFSLEVSSRSFRVDDGLRGVWVFGVFAPLAPSVLDLARVLAEYENRVVPRDVIERLLGRPAWTRGGRALDVRVSLLRRALAEVSQGGLPRVESVRGVCYRLLI